LEKRPEDRYQSATELHEDLQNFLAHSSAHLRNNFQMADYVAKIFSAEADALISDSGRRQAQAFFEGSESADVDRANLDFDVQQSAGPGAALARALRASALGVWAEASTGRAEPQAERRNEEQAADLDEDKSMQSTQAASSDGEGVSAPATAKPNPVVEDVSDHIPGRWNGVFVVGIVLAAASVVGLLWWIVGS